MTVGSSSCVLVGDGIGVGGGEVTPGICVGTGVDSSGAGANVGGISITVGVEAALLQQVRIKPTTSRAIRPTRKQSLPKFGRITSPLGFSMTHLRPTTTR